MLLTISTTHQPARDLGFLLQKNPDRVHTLSLPFGTVLMAYPEADDERCTFALTLDVDTIALARRRGPGGQRALEHYVNDRSYAASSFLSVAMARALRSAMAGASRERPELAEQAIPLTATVTPLQARGSETLLDEMFGALGYTVSVERHLLDPAFPEWGESPYVTLEITQTVRLADLLSHLYVLIPVLDRRKHYFVDRDELEKLLARGEPWLSSHPLKDLIVTRYLKYRKALAREALERLVPEEAEDDGAEAGDADTAEAAIERPIRLHDQRLERVTATLKALGARRVVDLGCGEGRLVRHLLDDPTFEAILAVDVSPATLERAADRLRLERLPAARRERLNLVQGSLVYRDRRLEGHDAIALVEVIEHIDPGRLPAVEEAVFAAARPRAVVVTTPNRAFNATFETMPEGTLRHGDHRFEWTCPEFEAWSRGVAARNGYTVRFEGIGTAHEAYGPPTQMAVFERTRAETS